MIPNPESCDKLIGRAVVAYADEVYEGRWESVSVAEFMGITAVVRAIKPVRLVK